MVNHFPPITCIRANGLPDAYYKAIKECTTRGTISTREYGKPIRTKNIISLIEISNPLQQPMLHSSFPTGELHLREYLKQWERGYKWKEQGFEYNYLDRLINYPITDISSKSKSIDQLKTINDKIAERIKIATENDEECLVSNRERATTWIPEKDLLIHENQPCLQSVQIFVYSYPRKMIIKEKTEEKIEGKTEEIEEEKEIIIPGKGEYICTWRSRDLYTAWNSNMIGLTLMLQREIFEPNNIKMIRCEDFCANLHIYESDWDDTAKVGPAVVDLHSSELIYEE